MRPAHRAGFRYILLNKPYDVLSQFTDEGTGHATLADYVPVPGVYVAGRLDRDSEGLLLLTNDGALIQRLTDPDHHLPKIYWVQVEGDPTADKLARLQQGVMVQGYQTLPCKAALIEPPANLPPRSKPVNPHGPVCWLEIQLQEGKKRQIRHMTAAVGLFTLRLLRVAIGPVRLGDLPSGKWRDLTEAELRKLRSKG